MPLAFEVRLRLLGADPRNRYQANIGIMCRELFQIRVIGGIDRPLHVGLTGTDPYLTHHDIFQ